MCQGSVSKNMKFLLKFPSLVMLPATKRLDCRKVLPETLAMLDGTCQRCACIKPGFTRSINDGPYGPHRSGDRSRKRGMQ